MNTTRLMICFLPKKPTGIIYQTYAPGLNKPFSCFEGTSKVNLASLIKRSRHHFWLTLLSSELYIYRGSSYSFTQKSSGTQLYLIVKLVRPASRISFSRNNTQLRPYVKERTITPFRRYRRIHSCLRTEISRT